ncbi:MAG: hypothetical protein DMG30_10500 [Acidobacteria bacterium]|nr:MAG: hypothetical protein DMG30_10500 [Acidobacteriota bacterium]
MSDANKRDAKAFAVVNHSVPRADGVAKVTGSATYALRTPRFSRSTFPKQSASRESLRYSPEMTSALFALTMAMP